MSKKKEDKETKQLRARIEDLLTDSDPEVRADLEKAVFEIGVKRFEKKTKASYKPLTKAEIKACARRTAKNIKIKTRIDI